MSGRVRFSLNSRIDFYEGNNKTKIYYGAAPESREITERRS